MSASRVRRSFPSFACWPSVPSRQSRFRRLRRMRNPLVVILQAFGGLVRAFASRKVLVHCQINLRAPSFVFLHRAIELREDPDRAYEAVSRVWKPDATLHAFIEAQLERNGIAFKLY